MTRPMRVLSWNVDKSSNREGRIDDQLAFIEDQDVDLLLLQEVRHGSDMQWADYWTEQLSALGLGEIEHSLDTAAELAASTEPPHDEIGHDNGHITAVTDEWTLDPRDDPPHEALHDGDVETTHFPEKILVADVETPQGRVEVWNVRAVPGSKYGIEKTKIFETVYDHLTESDATDKVLAGDFNTPAEELADGQAVPFGYDKGADIRRRYVNAELNMLKGLGHLGMIDVFRAEHGYGELETEDTSWRGKRFDHIFASEALGVAQCHYEPAGQECSDHAPIIAEFEL